MSLSFFRIFFLSLLFSACSNYSPLSNLYTFEDKTVFELIEKLNKNPSDNASVDLLPKAYKAAADKRKEINQANIKGGSTGDRYMQVNQELQVMAEMYKSINHRPLQVK